MRLSSTERREKTWDPDVLHQSLEIIDRQAREGASS
jgi:hypothetical protein